MNTQQISSIVRQVLAVLVSVYGVLTVVIPTLHLPVAVATALTAFGPTMLLLEHYVSDPSTGTTNTPTPTAPAAAAPVKPATADLPSFPPA